MSPHDLIDAYVSDVVRYLPRSQRADIALELTGLLNDELTEARTAPAAGADEQLVSGLLERFGHPADVAARYRPSSAVVDLSDRPRFWAAAVIGWAVIWGFAVRTLVGSADRPSADVLYALRDLWAATLIRSALWLAVVSAAFAAAAWVRRRRPRRPAWTPHPVQVGPVQRLGHLAGLVAAVIGVALLVDPDLLLGRLPGGRASAAYQAFAYDPDFTRLRAPVVLALLAARLGLELVLVVRGQWGTVARRVDIGLSGAICAALAWTVAAGPVFQAPPTDQLVRGLLVLIIVWALVDLGRKLIRRRRPSASTVDGSGQVWPI